MQMLPIVGYGIDVMTIKLALEKAWFGGSRLCHHALSALGRQLPIHSDLQLLHYRHYMYSKL